MGFYTVWINYKLQVRKVLKIRITFDRNARHKSVHAVVYIGFDTAY